MSLGHNAITHVVGRSCRSYETGDTDWADFTMICPHCHVHQSAAVIAYRSEGPHGPIRWMQCTSCQKPAVMLNTAILPAALYGNPVQHLPLVIDALYTEARSAAGANAPTAAELVCRTLLSHVAKHLEWDGTGGFLAAVDHIASSGYVTAAMRPWVDRIRTNANTSAHEFDPVTIERAQDALRFAGKLMELVFELPAIESQYESPA